MAFLFDIKDMMSSGASFRTEREKNLRVAVFVDAEASDLAVDALKAALQPQMSTARLHIEPVVPGDVLVVEESADVVIALAGPGATLAPSLAQARDRFIPAVAVSLGESQADVARRLQHPVLDTVTDDEPDELIKKLGRWLADRVSGKRLALAANFAFVRRAVAEEAIKNTAFQNAVIGGVMILPGADMPVMTANQGKMVLQIAAAYGEPLGPERIKELAAVVGGAFVFRAVARQALAFVPGLGWAIKAGMGYSATLGMGYAALEYFEEGGDVRGLATKLRETKERMLEKVRARGGSEEPPIPAHGWVVEDEPVEPAELVLEAAWEEGGEVAVEPGDR
jgi:uncharacterized protein (DUF697 family)